MQRFRGAIMTPEEVAGHILAGCEYVNIPIPLANLVGLNGAVILKAIENWCISNARHKKKSYFRNGYWWTHATYQDWLNQFKFLGSTRTIQRLVLDLEKQGLVISEPFQKNKFDRTKWYRLNRKELGALYLKEFGDIFEPPSESEVTQSQIVPKLDDDSDNLASGECQKLTMSASIFDPHLFDQKELTTQLFNQQLKPPYPVPDLPRPESERVESATQPEGEAAQTQNAQPKDEAVEEKKVNPSNLTSQINPNIGGEPLTPVLDINSAAAFLSSKNNQSQIELVPTTDKKIKLSQCRNFDEVRDYLENYPGEEFGGAIADELTRLNLLPWKTFERVKIFQRYNRNFVHFIAQGWNKEFPESRYADVVARLLKAERKKEVFVQMCSQW